MYSINIWSIVVATVASFIIGSLWYSHFLFGEEWMALIKQSNKGIEETPFRQAWKLYIIQMIATLITFVILGFTISILGIRNMSDGAFIGFFAWLGFNIPIGISELLWRKAPLKLIMIDSIYALLSLVIGGAIIAVL